MRKKHWKKKTRRRYEKVRRPVKRWGFPDLEALYGDLCLPAASVRGR